MCEARQIGVLLKPCLDLLGVLVRVDRDDRRNVVRRFAAMSNAAAWMPASIDRNRFSKICGYGSKPWFDDVDGGCPILRIVFTNAQMVMVARTRTRTATRPSCCASGPPLAARTFGHRGSASLEGAFSQTLTTSLLLEFKPDPLLAGRPRNVDDALRPLTFGRGVELSRHQLTAMRLRTLGYCKRRQAVSDLASGLAAKR